ncbi:MAG: glycine-rich domain-containing protein-like [Bacteroidota bacterium]
MQEAKAQYPASGESLFSLSHSSRLPQMDLAPVKRRMMHQPSGSWSFQQAEQVEPIYKAFLSLAHKYKGKKRIIPTEEIDAMWHCHILHTQKYHQDCLQAFGEMIHHYPGDEEIMTEAEQQQSFSQTQRLFKEEFGINLDLEKAAFCDAGPAE